MQISCTTEKWMARTGRGRMIEEGLEMCFKYVLCMCVCLCAVVKLLQPSPSSSSLCSVSVSRAVLLLSFLAFNAYALVAVLGIHAASLPPPPRRTTALPLPHAIIDAGRRGFQHITEFEMNAPPVLKYINITARVCVCAVCVTACNSLYFCAKAKRGCVCCLNGNGITQNRSDGCTDG